MTRVDARTRRRRGCGLRVAPRPAATGALHLAPDVLGVEAEAPREHADVLGLEERIAQVGDDRRRRAQRADAALDAREVVARDPLVDDELDHRHLEVDERADGAVAALQAQVAGIESLRSRGDVGLRVEALGVGEGAQRRLLAGGIRIEGEDDLARGGVVAHDAAEHRDVVGAEGRAARRDRGRDAGEVARHHVGVALDDDDAVIARDVALGEIEPVEHLRLVVDRGLGRVEVLRPVVVVVQPPRAEADHLTGHVADRPDHAAAEAVVDAALSLRDEAGAAELLIREARRAQRGVHARPAARRVADAEVRGGAGVEAPLAEEAPRGAGLGRRELRRGRTRRRRRSRRTGACVRSCRASLPRPRSAACSRCGRRGARRPR